MSNTLDSSSKKIGIDARLWSETGIGRYIRNLVMQLQAIDKKNEYILFVLSKDVGDISSHISNENFSLKAADIRWHTTTEQFEFPKILENESLDLVHFPYFSVPILYKGKFVLTIHDLILHHFPTGKASTHSWFTYQLKHIAYTYILSQASKKSEKIITVSHATEKDIMKDLNISKEKIIVTYEGFDTKIKHHQSSSKNLPEKYFLYVGNAYPHKNLERLVEAFKEFINHNSYSSRKTRSLKDDNSHIRSNNNIKLVLVGKEDFFYKRLEKKVNELNLTDNILFKHDVTDQELASLYAHALALVMPSLMEGFGLPVLEAMASNCLVILSDIPVFREIAQDTAIYFNPTHIQDIKNVLESIAKGNVPHETEKKQKGKEIATTFSWKKMAEQTYKVYQSCLGL